MKPGIATPKARSVHDLKTVESQSNLTLEPRTQLRKVFLRQQLYKPRKDYKLEAKPKPIAAKMGKITYKCGCVQKNCDVRPSININFDIKNPLQNKHFSSLSKNKTKSRDSLKSPSIPKGKVKRSSSLNNILERLSSLCQGYEQLLKPDTQRSRKFSVIKYVPKQILKSVDKIKRVERPVEMKVKKIKKIPKEVIKYKEVQREVPLYKEELVFIDSAPEKPRTNRVMVQREVVKEVAARNAVNDRMGEDLLNLRWRREKFGGEIQMSVREIEELRGQIQEQRNRVEEEALNRSKSVELLTPRQEVVVELDGKYDMNTSIETNNVNHSNEEHIFIRSKSHPLKNSYLSYKTRILVNGKEEREREGEAKEGARSLRCMGAQPTQSLIQINSSPEIKLEQRSEEQYISEGILTSEVFQSYRLKVTKI